jgi:Sulfotransferase family
MADAVYQSSPVFVFVHIPKTAGTTLRTILNMNEPGARSRSLGNVFKGGGGLSKAPVESMRSGRGPELKEGVRILRGHFPLGIREYLPNYLPQQRELRCFTFLREPIDRILSHYFAIREAGGAYRLPPLPPEASLDDALARGYVHDNLHTRMLCGDPEPFDEVTEEMLGEAKRNLRQELVFFGLTERFDESLVVAKRRLGLRGTLYRSSGRVNAARPRGDEIPAELRRTAERCNRYDIELYRYAQELFEEALEPARDLEFEVELAALRAAKSDGELEVTTPVPASFGGDEEAWGMLVRARATSERLAWEGARHRIPHVPATVQEEARDNELKAVRSKATHLEREVERLRDDREPEELRSTVKELEREVEALRDAHTKAKRLEQEVTAAGATTEKLEQQVERLTSLRARNKELQSEVESLRASSSRARKLEAEIERLQAAVARTEKLEQQVERLTSLRARNKKLQSEVQRLRAGSSKATELEQELQRLRVASSRTSRELEHRTERLKATQSRKQKLEEKLERLRAAKETPGIETR